MTICPLGDAFCEPIASFLMHFRSEFEDKIAAGKKMPAKKKPVLPVRSSHEMFGLEESTT
jgi:hypothetical protein